MSFINHYLAGESFFTLESWCQRINKNQIRIDSRYRRGYGRREIIWNHGAFLTRNGAVPGTIFKSLDHQIFGWQCKKEKKETSQGIKGKKEKNYFRTITEVGSNTIVEKTDSQHIRENPLGTDMY